MEGEVEDAGIIVEDILGSVPVTYVPIDDQNPIRQTSVLEEPGSNCYMVE